MYPIKRCLEYLLFLYVKNTINPLDSQSDVCNHITVNQYFVQCPGIILIKAPCITMWNNYLLRNRAMFNSLKITLYLNQIIKIFFYIWDGINFSNFIYLWMNMLIRIDFKLQCLVFIFYFGSPQYIHFDAAVLHCSLYTDSTCNTPGRRCTEQASLTNRIAHIFMETIMTSRVYF